MPRARGHSNLYVEDDVYARYSVSKPKERMTVLALHAKDAKIPSELVRAFGCSPKTANKAFLFACTGQQPVRLAQKRCMF